MTAVLLNLIILAVGFVLLIKGADFFVKGASAIARRFRVPQLIIGLTIVAMGTSAPEAAVSISAALSGDADITIGNVLGSNILNVLIVLGMTAVVAPVTVDKKAVTFDLPIVLGTTTLLVALGMIGRMVDRWEGLILLVIFCAYMVRLFFDAKEAKDPDGSEAPDDDRRPFFGQGNIWTYLMTLLGLAMIVVGSKATVYGATEIALDLGVSQRIIGLTIVAFGTSLPEQVTSVIAARRGEAGLAIGNIIGSNIFNILFVTGITALITPIAFIKAFLFDGVIAFAAALLLWIFAWRLGKLNQICGIIMLAGYAAYFIYLIL